jgi:catechol 2,3-dioxygenase-like lactoylglutathione lyase family enzyme
MIRSLQNIGFVVPNLEVGKQFYEDFGMEAREVGDAVAMRCPGHSQDQVVLVEGKERRLQHLTFGTRADEIGAMMSSLEAHGVELVDPPYSNLPYEAAGDGLWFNDPDGLLVNICVAEEAKTRSEPEMLYNNRGYHRRKNVRGIPVESQVVAPRRMGHVLLFTPDVGAKAAFYTERLGMKISDTMDGDVVAFLRNGCGGDHHVVALVKSDKPGFHHASFEFGTIDDIGLAGAALLEKGHQHCWGPGRHVVGSNYFHYVRDPWGTLIEHFADIDCIDENRDWTPRDWPLDGNLVRWAADGPPPEDFLANIGT